MRQKTIAITAALLVVAAFLLGFIPQYRKAGEAAAQLDSTRRDLATEQAKLQGGESDLLIGYIYLQTNLKNYGLASEAATKFFDRARVLAQQAMDPSRRKYFQSALAMRDAVTAGLAKGDPGTLPSVQQLFQGALETTEPGWK
jgi:hypothetical protein